LVSAILPLDDEEANGTGTVVDPFWRCFNLMIIYHPGPPGNQAWLAGKSPKCAFKWENDRTNRYVPLPGLIARGQSKSEGTSKYHNFVGKTL